MQTQMATSAGGIASPVRRPMVAGLAAALLLLVGMGIGVEIGRTLPGVDSSAQITTSAKPTAAHPYVFARWGGVVRMADTSISTHVVSSAPDAVPAVPRQTVGDAPASRFCWRLCPPSAQSPR